MGNSNSLNCTINDFNSTANGTALLDDDEEGTPLWVIGVACSVFSSAATSIGTILQKKAHNVNNAKPKEKRAKEFIGILMSPWWLSAFVLMVAVPLPFDFIALMFAAQSLIVPLAGVTIVLNQLLAPVLLGETLTRVEIVATVVILAGVLITTGTGTHNDKEFNICQILDRYFEMDFFIPILMLVGFMGGALVSLHKLDRPKYLEPWRPAMYAFLAGSFGAINNIFFKAVGELAQGGLSDEGDGGTWSTIHPYYHILLIIIFATLQISHINQGLRHYDAVMYIPLYNCNYIIFSGMYGAIYFGEFADYTVFSWIMFPVGIMLTLAGIALMSLKGMALSDVARKISPKNIISRKSFKPDTVVPTLENIDIPAKKDAFKNTPKVIDADEDEVKDKPVVDSDDNKEKE